MSNPTPIGRRMRSQFLPTFIVMTILWVVILQVMDLIPNEGQEINRRGEWRPATQFDRLRSLLLLTAAWYCGWLVCFAVYWRTAQTIFDMLFDEEGR